MANPLHEHMKILTDGDFLLSPSLTNIYEGLHGNGIMLLEDGATSVSGIRNTPASLPGYCKKKSGANGDINILRVRSGVAVIDGMLVDFGGGYNSNAPQDFDIELKQSTIEASNTALTTGQSCLLVVYVCTDGSSAVKHIKIEMGSAVSSGFPVTPEAFLSDPDSDFSSEQSTVLAVVKCVYEASNGTNNDLKLAISEVYNMTTYIKSSSPIYLAPMTKDVPGTFTNAINRHNDMDGMHGGGDETGSLSGTPFDALWVSKSAAGDSILLYSGDQDSQKRTWRLGPDIPTSYAGGSDQTFKFDGANIFHMTPTQSIELNPVGSFPRGHMIFIYNFSGHTIEFNETNDTNSGTAKFDVVANTSYIATFDGSIWKKTFVSTNVTSTAHGAAYRIQISNGSGSHTSDAGLTYNAGTDILTVTGKAAISGLIQDPTGLELTATGSNPGSTAGDTLWLNSGDSNRLYQGATKILRDGDAAGATTIVGLTDTPANFTGHGAKIVAVNGSASGNGTAVEFRNLAATDIPAALTSTTSIGPSSGTLTVSDDLTVTGDLIVSGGTTTLNVSDLQVEDLHIVIAKGGNDSATDGAGIIVDSSDGDKSILWANSGTSTLEGFKVNQHWLPSADSTLNLGESSAPLRWANVYADNLDTGTLVGSGDVTIDTNTLKVDVSENAVGINQATPLAPLHIADGVGFGYATGSSPDSANTAVDIVLFAHANFRGAKLLISIENSTDSDYEAHEIVITHNGSTAYTSSAYAQVKDASQTLCTVVGVLSGSNIVCRITPGVNSKAYSFGVSWQAIKKLT